MVVMAALRWMELLLSGHFCRIILDDQSIMSNNVNENDDDDNHAYHDDDDLTATASIECH